MTPFTVSLHVCSNFFLQNLTIICIQFSFSETMCFGALTFPRCVHDTAPQTGSCCSLLTAACKYARDKRLQERQEAEFIAQILYILL